MFAFFVNGQFKGFWTNKVGDKFADLTITKMKWPKNSTSLVFYQGLNGSEIKNCEPTLNGVDVIKDEVNEIGVDENDQPILETSEILVRSIQSDKFMIDGLMLIPC